MNTMRFADPSQYIMDEPDKAVFRVHRDVYTDEELF
jgi:hypothetical protein